MGRRRCHSLTGRACRTAGHTCPPTTLLLSVVKHRPVPLLHLDVLHDSLPLCPVDEQDKNVSVVTDDPNRFSTASCGLQHITTERDFCSLNSSGLLLCMGVGCWASDGSPSILFRLAPSSPGHSQLVHPRNIGQTAPVFLLLADNCSI